MVIDDTIHLKLTKEEVIYLYDALENTHAVDSKADIIKSIFQTVQGKLFSQAPFLMKIYQNVWKNRYCTENQFDKDHLFMGAGWLSFNRRNIMHKRLAYAAMILNKMAVWVRSLMKNLINLMSRKSKKLCVISLLHLDTHQANYSRRL